MVMKLQRLPTKRKYKNTIKDACCWRQSFSQIVHLLYSKHQYSKYSSK